MRQAAKAANAAQDAAARHVLHVGSKLEWIHGEGVPFYYTHGMNTDDMLRAQAAELARISGGI